MYVNDVCVCVCVCVGGDSAGVFGLGLVQGEWKLYVRSALDREQQDHYIINVTATDGLHVSTVSVDVTVTDANDNSPVCEQVYIYTHTHTHTHTLTHKQPGDT